jgi:hypothetical protein
MEAAHTSRDESQDAALRAAAASAAAHREMAQQERARTADRDGAIAQAVRSGARLEEIAEAASISRAAVSLAARRALPARPARGGPYGRSRGVQRALEAVQEATRRLQDVRDRTAEARSSRDRAIATAVDLGCGVRATARAVRMTPGSVSLIARSSAEEPSTQSA